MMTKKLQVWRFDDSVLRSHVVASSKDEAVEIFDRVMGREYRDVEDDEYECEIYPIGDETELSIASSENLSAGFVKKTAAEWIRLNGVGFL